MNYKLVFGIENSTANLDLLNQYTDTVKYIFNELSDFLIFFIKTALHTLLWISRPVYILLLIIGVFIYLTRIHRWLGRDLIFSSIALAIFSELFLPLIINYIESSYP